MDQNCLEIEPLSSLVTDIVPVVSSVVLEEIHEEKGNDVILKKEKETEKTLEISEEIRLEKSDLNIDIVILEETDVTEKDVVLEEKEKETKEIEKQEIEKEEEKKRKEDR